MKTDQRLKYSITESQAERSLIEYQVQPCFDAEIPAQPICGDLQLWELLYPKQSILSVW